MYISDFYYNSFFVIFSISTNDLCINDETSLILTSTKASGETSTNSISSTNTLSIWDISSKYPSKQFYRPTNL